MITIDKGFTSATFTRTFQKIDEFFAYVGGLIGTILGLIFIMSFYNEISYSISIGSKLFTYNKDEIVSSDSFNMITFFGFALYYPFNFLFGWCDEWVTMKRIREVRDEATKQLDVSLLMKRIYFLEKSVSLLLPEHHIELLYAQKMPTMDEA